MVLNVLSSEDNKNNYIVRIFTDEGISTLTNYTKSLIKEYVKKKPEEYPFKLGLVFGVPLFHWAHSITNKDDLLGRIIAYSQILGVDEYDIDIGDSGKIKFSLKETDFKGDYDGS